jgi:hypothetical protein
MNEHSKRQKHDRPTFQKSVELIVRSIRSSRWEMWLKTDRRVAAPLSDRPVKLNIYPASRNGQNVGTKRCVHSMTSS